MALNAYSAITSQIATELTAGLSASYSGLVVSRRLFNPQRLPAFSRYAVIVSPHPRPWDEERLSVSSLRYIYRIDLFVLVKNWEETDNPLFGLSAGSLGIFQLVQDLKDLLRLSNLNGLIDKTYDEPGGDARREGAGGLEFGAAAAQGFDAATGDQMAHRVRVQYLAKGLTLCHPRL